jgi:F0F1-type ATP synthase membrane subunit b/b'
MLDEKFWLAIAFTAFAILIVKYVWPLLAKSIDSKSKAIAEEILAAKKMKEKAQKLLDEAEKFYLESLNYSKKLAADAQNEAQKLADESKQILESELKKKTAAALDRIKLEEEGMIREIKLKVVSDTMEALSKNFGLDEKSHEQIVEKSLKNFERIQ